MLRLKACQKKFLLSEKQAARHVSDICEDGLLGEEFQESRETFYRLLFVRRYNAKINSKAEVNIFAYFCVLYVV